jgi:ATP-dependent RNA circularization protein (DNA/RNA ligase family)
MYVVVMCLSQCYHLFLIYSVLLLCLFQLLKMVEASECIEEAKELRHEYGQKASQALAHFPPSDAHEALSNIVRAVTAL